MLTGPVFQTKVLLSSYHDFPSFDRTYQQLRDLLCFIAAALGLIHPAQIGEVLSLCNTIGKLLDKQMRQGWQSDANAPLKLRDALMDVLAHLLSWQAAASNAAEKQQEQQRKRQGPPAVFVPPPAVSTEPAAGALRLIRKLFHALGTALSDVDEGELDEYLDMQARKAHYEAYTRLQYHPVGLFVFKSWISIWRRRGGQGRHAARIASVIGRGASTSRMASLRKKRRWRYLHG